MSQHPPLAFFEPPGVDPATWSRDDGGECCLSRAAWIVTGLVLVSPDAGSRRSGKPNRWLSHRSKASSGSAHAMRWKRGSADQRCQPVEQRTHARDFGDSLLNHGRIMPPAAFRSAFLRREIGRIATGI